MKYSWLTGILVLLVVVPALAAFQLDGMDWPGRWCAAGDIPSRCLRDWLASYSGWAAAFGALIAAIMTIGPLRQQVLEAKRQTDYIVGDAEPEFVLLRNTREKRVILRVTNWNRRTVMIKQISCSEPTGLKVHNAIDFDDKPDWETQKRDRQIPRFRIDGWYDQKQKVPRRRLIVVFARDGIPEQGVAERGERITLSVSYRIIGQLHEDRVAVVIASELDE